MGIHATHLRRQNSRENFLDTTYQKSRQNFCDNCETNLSQSRPNIHHLLQRNTNFSLASKPDNFMMNNRRPLEKCISLSQGSLSNIQANQTFVKSDANIPMLRRSVLRLSKSEESISNVHNDLKNFKRNPEAFQKKKQSKSSANEQLLDYSSSEEEYFTDSINLNEENNQNFDTMSTESCCSITTDGNCDFEFYQNSNSFHLTSVSSGANVASLDLSEKDSNVICMHVSSPEDSEESTPRILMQQAEARLSRRNSFIDDLGPNFRITRSNSKRSLENFQAYISENSSTGEARMQRSSSYISLGERPSRSNSKLSEQKAKNVGGKYKSAETLHKGMNSVVYIKNVGIEGEETDKCNSNYKAKYGGSVPDFKKIFISEYI